MEDSIQLARLAGSLQRFAFSQCDFIKTELHSERSTQKIATLITTLYGSGYGTDAWLQIAREFSEMRESRWEQWIEEIMNASNGETMDLATALQRGESPSVFRRFLMNGALAHEMILQVRDHYHDHFDPLLFRYKSDLGISEETRNLHTSELYRTMAIFQLGQHLQGADISAPQRNRAQSVLKLIPLSSTPKSLVPYFFGQSNYPLDVRQMGGKGRGLHLLQGWYPNNTPLGFSLPARAADYKLSEQDRRNISAAILHLETTSRRKLGTDLFVSVRSGSAISMPGTMKTTLNVGSTEELFRQVEEIYASWDSPIAKSYRLANGIPDELGTAVHIVQMVDGTKDERSGSGIALSFPQEANSVELANNNPDKRGTNEVKIVFGRQVRGEALVSGTHTGEDPLPTTQLQKELQKSIHELERHYGLVSGYGHAIPVEVEYTIESGKIYFLQIRRAHLTIEEEIRWFTNQFIAGEMTQSQALRVLGGRNALRQALHLKAIDT
ncbi:MAG: hypothetical protein JNK65_09340, partial [Deltaproteobacteria bacterium]|nr:hypothetical protein [Deltaproteobacteria bacterium]